MTDLDELEYGDVIDMFTEKQNDEYEWPDMATQEDIDALAR